MDKHEKNNTGLQILTDTGWQDFSGLITKGSLLKTVLIRTPTANLQCTLDHKVYLSNFRIKPASQLRVGDILLTQSGKQPVVSVTLMDSQQTYDVANVSSNSRYYANGILVSNCEFIINDETLINALTLVEMSGIDPLEKRGQVRWYKKPTKGKMYAVALDPSLGTGGDFAAIQVLELPSLLQVAEWQHNKTPIQKQIKLLKEICDYLYEEIGTETDIYYSVENNTLGEAALVSISELGEENIRGTFMSETAKPGTVKRGRKGFTTTNRSKVAVCAKFKQLVESGKFKVASKNLLSELKNFVASGGSYAAKAGETDDLVMSMLLALRISQSLQNYDQNLDNVLRGDENFVAPMPFIMF